MNHLWDLVAGTLLIAAGLAWAVHPGAGMIAAGALLLVAGVWDIMREEG